MRLPGTVWIADDDDSIRWVLSKALGKAGLSVESFSDADALVGALSDQTPDLIITDVQMPGMSGFELLASLTSTHPDLPIVVMTAYADLDNAVSAFSGGAFEYLPKPFDLDEVLEVVEKALRTVRAEAVSRRPAAPQILGSAPAMQEVYRVIGRLAKSNMSVLITGESGTGKELVARALHDNSPRAGQQFVALNMAAIPRDLLESELFGHERGAFTGAQSKRIGRFEQAAGGTLFLDEIGDMPAELQTRLLRVLSEEAFFRVGGHEPIESNVRVIAATHQPLEVKVEDGSFRSDLFHRLNVVRMRLPALRERAEDIPALLTHYLQVAAAEMGVPIKRLTPDASARLQEFAWPGNVRQLENTCRRLTVMAPGDLIGVEDLRAQADEVAALALSSPPWHEHLSDWLDNELRSGRENLLDELLPQFEETIIRCALRQAGGRRQAAARLLGWGRNTLTRKIHSLRLTDLGED